MFKELNHYEPLARQFWISKISWCSRNPEMLYGRHW